MRKIEVLCALFILPVVWNTVRSQKQVEDQLFKVNALLPGVSYEIGVGSTSTLNFEGIIGFALNGGSDRSAEFGIFPGVQAEYRNYLKLDRRIAKSMNISGNSGNYISLLNQFHIGTLLFGYLEYNSDYFYNLAVMYGIQRTRPKGFYSGVSLAPAFYTTDNDPSVSILSDNKLGWLLGSG